MPALHEKSAPAAAEPSLKNIDTSKMSAGQRAAFELTEAARDLRENGNFVAQLFLGHFVPELIHPLAPQEDDDLAATEAFLRPLATFLREQVDPDAIDRAGEVPEAVLQGLARLGAFGIKIPRTYGGLGLSQTGYARACQLIGSHCANLFALISIHQSVGVPQPLLLFGSEEQKRRYLPRVAAGEISAFALTEQGVGSDPARMACRATPSEDGSHFVLEGEKLWCSNGTRAGVIIITAKTPLPAAPGAKPKEGITAFILEMATPGVEVTHRCQFMGLRALYNGVVRFRGVRIPRENIVGGEGRGLKVALSTLNSGRLSIPASCVGISKRALRYAREWSARREQWGAPIGRHAAIAEKLRRMAARTFACEAMEYVTCAMVDRDKRADIRLEAAMTKMFVTEQTWHNLDDLMQIRGGRGYETADSLAARGDEAMPVERMFRDARVNTIFEGSSEIMRLFIMREALEPHLKAGGAAINTQLPWAERLRAASRAAGFYARWYPSTFVPQGHVPAAMDPACARHLHWVGRTARKMARRLFHQMVRRGPALEKEQPLLGRFADIGADLYAIACACVLADRRLQDGAERTTVLQLLEDVVAETGGVIARKFHAIDHNVDASGYAVAQTVLEGKMTWLEDGIL